jgi:hypothetical protein
MTLSPTAVPRAVVAAEASEQEPSMENRLPLVIGVTGHCEIHNTDLGLKKAVKDYFADLRRAYPHTPILLLSQLAEAADRLVVKWALELNREAIGPIVDLLVVQAMQDELFLQEFDDPNHPAQRAEYDDLVAVARRKIVLPLLSPAAEVNRATGNAEARDLQFLFGGAFVARRCHILLAMWDDSADNRLGSTDQIVQFKQSGRVNAEVQRRLFVENAEPYLLRPEPLDVPETGPIVRILVPAAGAARQSATCERKNVAPLSYYERGASERDREEYFERFDIIHKRNLDRFNLMSLELSGQALHNRENEQQQRIPDTDLRRLPDSLKLLRNIYATADQLAISLQSRLEATLVWSVILIATAVIAFSAYAHLVHGPASRWLLFLYLLLLAIADAVYLYATKSDELNLFERRPRWLPMRGRDDQDRYQDYRTLCEGLRVQLYWRLAGMKRFASDHYFGQQKNEIEWIRKAVETWGLLAEPATQNGSTTLPSSKRLELVKEGWIVDQIKYYIKASYRERVKQSLFQQIGAGFLAASLFTSLAVLLIRMVESDERLGALILGAPIIIVAVLHVSSKISETKREAREDNEDFTRSDRIAQDKLRIETPHHLPKTLNNIWLRPLRRLLGSSSAIRPGMRRVAGCSFAYGAALGLGTTLLLWAFYEVLNQVLGEDHPMRLLINVERRDWLIVAMILDVAFAALIQWYSASQAFGAHYRRYKQAMMPFVQALDEVTSSPQNSTAEAIWTTLSPLGREALSEHAAWLILHRERPIELPKLEL